MVLKTKHDKNLIVSWVVYEINGNYNFRVIDHHSDISCSSGG